MAKHEHDRGLAHDLEVMNTLIHRRGMLGWLGAAGLVPLIGCATRSRGGNEPTAGSVGGDSGAGAGSGSGSCTVIPEETQGPYPGDGSNGPNVLAISGIVRSDIRSSLGGLSGTAQGVPLTVKITLMNASVGCNPLAGHAVYAWHCDRDGNYSLYTVADQNYLRGVQETSDDGSVTFQTIFPGCYGGRWPHIHFAIYPSLNAATSAPNTIKTSQLAFPEDACKAAYATSGYSSSVTNLARISLASDNVFNDGSAQQVASVTGSASEGYVATLAVAIAG
jgi:protocatechuate 3,4-dioxygenase beta subunit